MKRQILYYLGSIVVSLLTSSYAADIASSTNKITEQGLNVLTAAIYSCSNHITPILEIYKQLAERLHHITLVTNISQSIW
jgi:hypothetical protein